MLLVQAFRVHQREPVSICLVNVDMTPKQRFAELCLDGVMWYCCRLPFRTARKFRFLQLSNDVLGMELFIVLLKIQGYLIQFTSLYPGYWSNLKTGFLISNDYTVNCTLVKNKKYPEY